MSRTGGSSCIGPKGAAVYASTLALVTDGPLTRTEGGWVHGPSGTRFDPDQRAFIDAPAGALKPLAGFDTFWYVWSLTHPDTQILDAQP